MFKKIIAFLSISLYAPLVSAGSIIIDPTGDPPKTANDIEKLLFRLQDIVFAAAGGIAVAMIVWGAIILLTAGGNEEKTGKGKKILTYAIGGIILIVSAYTIITMYITILGGDVRRIP